MRYFRWHSTTLKGVSMSKLKRRSGIVSALRKRHPGGIRVHRDKPRTEAADMCMACYGDGGEEVKNYWVPCWYCQGKGTR